MSIQAKRIQAANLLKGLAKGFKCYFIQAEVKSIEGITCTVSIGDMDISGVNLQATEAAPTDSYLVIPKIGSMVLVGSLTGDYTDLVVIKCDSVEKIELKKGTFSLIANGTSGKITVKSGNSNLATLLQDLCDMLQNLKVATPAGPSTNLMPDSLQAVITLKQKLQLLFE